MLAILNIFLSSLLANACVDDVTSTDRHTLQTMSLDRGALCTLRVSPRDISQTQRKFILNNHGMVMVFVDKPKGTVSNTGSRTYHIVPVSGAPKVLRGDQPYFKDSSGMEWKLRSKEWKPESCDVSIGSSPTLENQGAYDILKCEDRFVIDSGFMRGTTSIRRKNGTSKIIGPSGVNCTVPNSKIFDYTDKDEVKLKLQTSSQIKSFVRLIPACATMLDHKPHEGVEQRIKVPEAAR